MATRNVILKFVSGSNDTQADSAVLDATNWGANISDSVRFVDAAGRIVNFSWDGVLYVRESNVPPPPPIPPPPDPPLPNWLVRIWWVKSSGARDYEVSPATKAQMLLDLEGPGSEDQILEFDTFSNYRMRCPSKAIACINFLEQT